MTSVKNTRCISNSHFLFKPVAGGDTGHGGLPWLVSTPASDNLKCAQITWLICGAFLILFLCNIHVYGQSNNLFPLIPYPSKIIAGNGFFTITPRTTISISDPSLFKNEADLFSKLFINSFGQPLSQKAKGSDPGIRLVYDESITSSEGYRILSTPQKLTLFARTPAGMFCAVQTIRQLLPLSIEKKQLQTKLTIPALTIEDHPSFEWRGMHLDVSRHFFSIDYLKKLADLMALYKFNKLHLHLTDDQGWRIEIKKYPKLTEHGAWRTFNHQDSLCMKKAGEDPDFIIDPKHIIKKNGRTLYGGFYTQQQMKEFVAYAAARHIDIIPEIDMPGHMMAAIDAYHYLSCDSTSAFGKLFSIPICPCLPTTIEFAKDIFTEIMDIFPSEYVHIGGDEVDRSFWEKSAECKALMQREGLKTSAELQAWFINSMEKFFNSKGRKLIGWDEILEGGISKTAAIMYWRTWVPKAPVEAAENGNKVIMSPGSPMYFSEQPDKNSLPAVYHYDIIPNNLSASQAKNIIGAQGNLWTETIPTEKRADYLYMPRMTALAEILWSGNNDYRSYLERLQIHYKRLDALSVNYRLPDLPLLDNYAFTDSIAFTIEKPIDDLVTRYTLDSTLPGVRSGLLLAPLLIRRSQHLRIAAFTKTGRRGDVYDVFFKKQDLAKAETVTTNDGLICKWYKRSFDSTVFISGTPDRTFTVANITVPKEAEAAAFTIQYGGYINVPGDGIYTFYLTSDDGSVLKIAGREVVNNDGMHAPRERNGQVALAKGAHSIALDFIEGGGGYTLKLMYSKDGSEPQDIPSAWFKN